MWVIASLDQWRHFRRLFIEPGIWCALLFAREWTSFAAAVVRVGVVGGWSLLVSVRGGRVDSLFNGGAMLILKGSTTATGERRATKCRYVRQMKCFMMTVVTVMR